MNRWYSKSTNNYLKLKIYLVYYCCINEKFHELQQILLATERLIQRIFPSKIKETPWSFSDSIIFDIGWTWSRKVRSFTCRNTEYKEKLKISTMRLSCFKQSCVAWWKLQVTKFKPLCIFDFDVTCITPYRKLPVPKWTVSR